MYRLEEAKASAESSKFNRLNLLDCILTYINTKVCIIKDCITVSSLNNVNYY